MRLFIPVLAVVLFFSSCKTNTSVADTKDTLQINGHPAWMLQGNIYEVNVRQYTPEGTFRAFEAHLDRLKDMGVHTIWFMPIQPISKLNRKGTLGSYYAVADYTGINPEYGNLKDWKHLVKLAHEKGLKVMMDWVPNHTGADHYWLQKHPDFYVRDSNGVAVSQFDWTDTRKLNFANTELRDTMIAQMKFWVTESDIDGFRCDYAVGPKADQFWIPCVQALKKMKNLFMLAEADSAWLHTAGFDATYAWPEFHTMVDIAGGKKKASDLTQLLQKLDSSLPANAIRLWFTSNHDENSWNKADYATMPGASHTPFSVLTHTMPRSLPLIYSGQEEPILRPIPFFEKDTIVFKKYERAAFYQKLTQLRARNKALRPDAAFQAISTNQPDQVIAFLRTYEKQKVLVVVNVTANAVTCSLSGNTISGNYKDVFSAAPITFAANPTVTLEPWGYKVYELNN